MSLPNSTTIKGAFTIVANAHVRNPELSGTAFKLLCIGLSHNDNWIFRKNQILTYFKEGEYAFNAAMKELRAIGHLHLVAKKTKKGTFEGYNWFWFDVAVSAEEFKEFHRNSENRAAGLPGSRITSQPENRVALRINKEKKTKEKNTKENNNAANAAEEKPAAAVVVSSGEKGEVFIPKRLQDLEIPSSLKLKIAKKHTETAIDEAIDCCEDYNPYNLAQCLQKALNEGWKRNPPADDFEKVNNAFLDSFNHNDGKRLGDYTIEVGPSYILFRHPCIDGSKNVSFKKENKNFKAAVMEFLKTQEQREFR